MILMNEYWLRLLYSVDFTLLLRHRVHPKQFICVGSGARSRAEETGWEKKKPNCLHRLHQLSSSILFWNINPKNLFNASKAPNEDDALALTTWCTMSYGLWLEVADELLEHLLPCAGSWGGDVVIDGLCTSSTHRVFELLFHDRVEHLRRWS